jgi:hypothetical protein
MYNVFVRENKYSPQATHHFIFFINNLQQKKGQRAWALIKWAKQANLACEVQQHLALAFVLFFVFLFFKN